MIVIDGNGNEHEGVLISHELALGLLENTNDLLQQVNNFRKYPRYEKICIRYETEIAELKAALEK